MRNRLLSRQWRAAILIVGLCLLHDAAIFLAMGGRAGFASSWPVLIADNGMHYHHAVRSAQALRETGRTASYDPSFMSGYAMSIVSDASANLAILAVWAFGRSDPADAYQIYVLSCMAAIPWLMALAGFAWRAGPNAVAAAVLFNLIYFWTDFPKKYAICGMLAYLVAVPMVLVTTAALTGYLDRGGRGRWAAAALGSIGVFLVHPTTCMILAPAAALAYVAAIVEARRSGRQVPAIRHAALWCIPIVVVLANVFWLVPGIRLLSTKGNSAFAFFHPEPVAGRLGSIVVTEPPIQAVLCGLGLAGLAVLWRRDRVAAAGLGGLMAAGFGWGYLAGFSRALDFLQPGRHTYAFYTAAALASAIGVAEAFARLRVGGPGRLDRWMSLGCLLIGLRFFGLPIAQSAASMSRPEPLLAGRPSPRLSWILDCIRIHLHPGERLLYEEGGRAIPGVSDPFRGRNYSGVIPSRTGVELLGGPYLHIPVKANFTQFGEGKLFGKDDWDRAHFVRYARLYRPAAILCWTPKARAFCLANPDLIRILEDDGTMLFGRVLGFEGPTIRGIAAVTASPGRLRIGDATPDADGLVVLRYHSIPHLRTVPVVPLESIYLEDDPVPFIAFRPRSGVKDFEITFSP